MQWTIDPAYRTKRDSLQGLLEQFEQSSHELGDGNRNIIRVLPLDKEEVAIKSFKVPHLVNRWVYRFFRKSKAQRSFEYAQILIQKQIGTPAPVAFGEEKQGLLFGRSVYISRFVHADLTYRELIHQPDYPNRTELLRAFTRFTFDLHEKGIHFLDHSPGNTLIVLSASGPVFYLVDLNRMEFGTLDLQTRLKNFSRLTPKREMVKIMATEYARLIDQDEQMIFDHMWAYTQAFRKRFENKKKWKRTVLGRK
ncbi:lipopolysaccharide kinase InaA family protein [Croceiramulus getboli]|nr:lipopolysaccharide kinase InaA family protein [Flavobacteriaceae bacterium YJPT1-3]